MENMFEKEFSIDELEEFLNKDFTDDEIDNIRGFIIEYYECAGFANVDEKYGFSNMSKEKIIDWFKKIKYDEIELKKEYFGK